MAGRSGTRWRRRPARFRLLWREPDDLHDGRCRPLRVCATTHQFKPHLYPKVDDDATILVSYPDAECVIQASWNWPVSRKDMEIYAERAQVIAINNRHMRTRAGDKVDEFT